MKFHKARLLALSVLLCLLGSPSAFAVQSGLLGLFIPCGSSGILITNSADQPTNFDLGADWSGFACKVALVWTDARGQSRALNLNAPPPTSGATSTYFPSRGVSSSLSAGASITWTAAAGDGGGVLNLTFQRPPSTLVSSGTVTSLGTATFGPVGGKLGPFSYGANTGENVRCGSKGTFYNNATYGPITFDLMVHNESPGDNAGTATYYCGVTVSWKDAGGIAHRLDVTHGLARGVTATSLPMGGYINWTSWGYAGAQLAFQWQFERAVEVPGP